MVKEPVATATDEQLLDELQRLADRHGKVEAAGLLGLNYRTLTSALESCRVSRRVREAAEQYFNDASTAVAEPLSDPAVDQQLDPLKLEQQLGDIHEALAELREAVRELQVRLPDRAGAAAPRVEIEPPRPAQPQAPIAQQPVVIPLESEPGEIWLPEIQALVEQWREANADRATARHTLAWLQATRRMLELEIALVDDHQLTLPPAHYAWTVMRRGRELHRRHAALRSTRVRLFWTTPLHRLMRALTLGLWGR